MTAVLPWAARLWAMRAARSSGLGLLVVKARTRALKSGAWVSSVASFGLSSGCLSSLAAGAPSACSSLEHLHRSNLNEKVGETVDACPQGR